MYNNNYYKATSIMRVTQKYNNDNKNNNNNIWKEKVKNCKRKGFAKYENRKLCVYQLAHRNSVPFLHKTKTNYRYLCVQKQKIYVTSLYQ